MQGPIRLDFPKVGDRVRFAIQHAGAWRPLLWLRVGKDGSIYLGVLLGRPSVAKAVSRPAAKQLQVKYNKLQHVQPPKSSRVSFKASGEIHLGDQVFYGKPLSSLTKPRQLCLMHFAHPSRYSPPQSRNRNDYDVGIVGYTPDEDKPMYAALIVAPLSDQRPTLPAKLPNMEAAVTFAFGYRELTRTPDLIVQIILGNGPTGPWPQLPGVLVAGKASAK